MGGAIRGVNLLPTEGTALYLPRYFPEKEADELFTHLSTELDWSQERARLFGRQVPLPRLTAWYGAVPYAYSGVVHPPADYPPSLARTQARVEPVAPGVNCVLGNYYRDGNDGVAWHADDDQEAGEAPLVCSVSFGATRRFVLRHRATGERVDVELQSGDVLVMSGATQHHWQHAVPKSSRPLGPRINLTFRRFGVRPPGGPPGAVRRSSRPGSPGG